MILVNLYLFYYFLFSNTLISLIHYIHNYRIWYIMKTLIYYPQVCYRILLNQQQNNSQIRWQQCLSIYKKERKTHQSSTLDIVKEFLKCVEVYVLLMRVVCLVTCKTRCVHLSRTSRPSVLKLTVRGVGLLDWPYRKVTACSDTVTEKTNCSPELFSSSILRNEKTNV